MFNRENINRKNVNRENIRREIIFIRCSQAITNEIIENFNLVGLSLTRKFKQTIKIVKIFPTLFYHIASLKKLKKTANKLKVPWIK